MDQSGYKKDIGDAMFKKIMMSAVAAAAIAGVHATANAQVLVPIEIEGPLSEYVATTANSGTMTVLNVEIDVNATTSFTTPTGSRDTWLNNAGNPVSLNQWIAGGNNGTAMEGRVEGGILGGTVIVTGEYDTATGRIFASEVFTDVAENVVLGVITDNHCETWHCQGPNDYIRGNGALDGSGGVVFEPNNNPRLKAGRITDAGLFEINLAGKSLVGTPDAPTTFAGEGYLSDNKVFPSDAPAEQALIYWAFELGENRPDLLRNRLTELSVLRVRCTEGGRLEARGFVHSPVNAAGNPRTVAGHPTSGGDGVITATMVADGQTFEFVGEAPDPDVPASYGVYRLRADVDVCGDSVDVHWRPTATGTPWYSVLGAPVDRLREE